jgi:hypothetical protein
LSHPFINIETRDKLICQSIDALDTLSSRYERGAVDTLGFFDELGRWTRETSLMLQTAINTKTAQDFNACSLVEDKKVFLVVLINHGRKRVILS